MSVLLERQSGDPLVCIESFNACPEGQAFSWGVSRRFEIGERVRYVEARQDPHFKDRPNGWLAVFEPITGERYAAAQTYFVTEECWNGIEHYFVASVGQRR